MEIDYDDVVVPLRGGGTTNRPSRVIDIKGDLLLLDTGLLIRSGDVKVVGR